jgi:hypothetical protein
MPPIFFITSYSRLKMSYKSKNLSAFFRNILHGMTIIFNGDESGFQLCPNTGKAVACKGDRSVYEYDRRFCQSLFKSYAHLLRFWDDAPTHGDIPTPKTTV